MACYHPWIGIPCTDEYGVLQYRMHRISGFGYEQIKANWPDSILIPCGKCIGCRLDHSRRWADRMVLELDVQKKALFLTLTYDCRHVVDADGNLVCKCVHPEVENTKKCPCRDECANLCRLHGSLYKRHLQLFFKSLRKEMSKKGIKLRYYACGEYGSFQNTHRPHMHIILYGLGLDDLQNKKVVGVNELRQTVYSADLIACHWPYGFVSAGSVSWESCAYVARYVQKKALAPEESLLLEKLHLNPEFSVMSRKPGIGKPYLDEHPDCLQFQKISIGNGEFQKDISIPKYFLQTDSCISPSERAILLDERSHYADDRMMQELSGTDDYLADYLEKKEGVFLSRISSLKKRDLAKYQFNESEV